MLSFFPRGVLDGILKLIESVSEGFLSYSYNRRNFDGVFDHIGLKDLKRCHFQPFTMIRGLKGWGCMG